MCVHVAGVVWYVVCVRALLYVLALLSRAHMNVDSSLHCTCGRWCCGRLGLKAARHTLLDMRCVASDLDAEDPIDVVS